MTLEAQEEVSSFLRRMESGHSIPAPEHMTLLKRLNEKLRGIYNAITCTRSSDVAHGARRRPPSSPPRQSTQHLLRPEMTYGHNMPPPPPSFQPGGSSWQHQPPPPSFQPGGSSWHHQMDQYAPPPPHFQAGTSSFQQHIDPRASTPIISTGSYDDASYDEHIFDERAYGGFGSQPVFQTPPPHATQDTQTATQETLPHQDEPVYGRGFRERRGPAIRLSPSGPRPRKLQTRPRRQPDE